MLELLHQRILSSFLKLAAKWKYDIVLTICHGSFVEGRHIVGKFSADLHAGGFAPLSPVILQLLPVVIGDIVNDRRDA